jgi:hypothetical protein
MMVSIWPFRQQDAYMSTIRRRGRRRRLLAIGLPVAVCAIVLQYIYPPLAAALLVVPAFLVFVVVPRWARQDSLGAVDQES